MQRCPKGVGAKELGIDFYCPVLLFSLLFFLHFGLDFLRSLAIVRFGFGCVFLPAVGPLVELGSSSCIALVGSHES